MKIIKICIASLLLMSMSAFAQNKFVTNQLVDDNITVGNATGVNVNNLARIDPNCAAAKTIVLTYTDGSVKNWVYATVGECNTVLDKFYAISGARAQGGLLFYTSQYGTNIHMFIPYENMFDAACVKTNPGGGAFYTVTITLKTGGAPIVSNGYDIGQCTKILH